MNASILNKVRQLAEPYVAELGLELVDVEYVREGAYWYLRIYIDKEGGVDIDDCTEVSRKMNDVLDKANLISQAYMLEVSSPGIERPLKKREDYEKYKGELVSIYPKELYQGYNCFTGNLVGLVDDQVVLEYEGQQIAIPLAQIERAHLSFDF
ncbi:ribosome maturation factor RimP [Dehalobacter sp. DCM]|uniref:ribosome maturation factor RimP n=1 Tax=Dehalobacter sp. DCM TaxID=2907827 RepID=UPI0030817999|nr:ribosome maturation factor RimP [Dehalobacter sp. DCM]